MTLLKKLLGEVPFVYEKGGKGSAPAPVVQETVAPSAPVQMASVQKIQDEEDLTEEFDEEGKKKLATSKKSLSIPLAETVDSGLKA